MQIRSDIAYPILLSFVLKVVAVLTETSELACCTTRVLILKENLHNYFPLKISNLVKFPFIVVCSWMLSGFRTV
jgi:hypothetical protein